MSVFLLSPGITPEITDIFVIGFPIALGLGYLLRRRIGFEVAFVLNALALAGVKLATDYFDPWDDAVTLATLLGATYWSLALRGTLSRAGTYRGVVGAAALLVVLIGILKIVTDFYDPFDILQADATIVAGLAVWVYRRGYPGKTEIASPSGNSNPPSQ